MSRFRSAPTRPQLLRATSLALLLGVTPHLATAQTVWTGGGDITNVFDDGNWTLSSPGSLGDPMRPDPPLAAITEGAGGSNPVIDAGEQLEALSFTIRDGATTDGQLDLNGFMVSGQTNVGIGGVLNIGQTGELDGPLNVLAAGQATIEGEITGAATNAGSTSLVGATGNSSRVLGVLRNEAGGQMTVVGPVSADGGVVNTGEDPVDSSIPSTLTVAAADTVAGTPAGVLTTTTIATNGGARTVIAGTATASGAVTVAGAGGVSGRATALEVTGDLSAGSLAVTNGATASVDGTLTSDVTVSTTGTLTLSGDVAADAGAGIGGTIINEGIVSAGNTAADPAQVAGLMTNQTGGDLTVRGVLAADGGVTTTGAGSSVVVAAADAGAGTAAGVLQTTTLTNQTGGSLQVQDGASLSGTVMNTGVGATVTVASGGTLTGNLTTDGGATFDLDGTVDGDVTNASTGPGPITSSAAGTVTGALRTEANATTFVTGDLAAGSVVVTGAVGGLPPSLLSLSSGVTLNSATVSVEAGGAVTVDD
ncbi:MAG: hypothetical protein AAGE03_06055, partial [Pseudomonadota bacterium]